MVPMLKTLRIANWTSHKDSEIVFGKGANIFVGVMGSGKSSALEALSFALFGSIPEGSRRKARLADAIRFGEENASVELEMEMGSSVYRVIRKIGRKGSSEAWVYRGDALVAQTPAMANKFLESLLGMNYDLFSTIVYSAQNKMDSFISLPPKGRKEAIDEIIGLNSVLKVEDNSTKILNRLRLVAKEISSLMPSASEMEGKAKELDNVNSSISGWRGEEQKTGKAVAEARESLSGAAKAYSAVSGKRKEHDNIMARISASKGRIGALEPSCNPTLNKEKEAELISSIEILKKEIAEAEQMEKSLLKDANLTRERIADAKSDGERRKKALEDTARMDSMLEKLGKKDEAAARISSSEKTTMSLNEKIGTLKAGLDAAAHGIKEIGKAGTKCPVCTAELSEGAKSHIEKEWKAKHAESLRMIKESESALASASKDLEALRERLKKMEFYSAKREALLAQVSEIKRYDAQKDIEALSVIEAKVEDCRKKAKQAVSGLASAEGALKEARKNIMLMKEIQTSKSELLELEKKVSALGYSEEDYKKAETDYREVSSSAERAKAGLEKIRAEIAMGARMKSELETVLKKHNAEKERYAKVESLISDVSLFKEALNRMQLILRNNIISDINSGINEVWEYAYPYNDYGKIRLIGDGDSYNFEVFANGEWRDISAVASGGEKTMAAIALRITLAMVLAPQMGCIVLDEPTHNLDENGIEKLSSLIKERLPSLIEQFVIVTHDNRLMSSGIGNVFQFSREKSGNDPTSVEKVG
jgi:exonuclease SbcC